MKSSSWRKHLLINLLTSHTLLWWIQEMETAPQENTLSLCTDNHDILACPSVVMIVSIAPWLQWKRIVLIVMQFKSLKQILWTDSSWTVCSYNKINVLCCFFLVFIIYTAVSQGSLEGDFLIWMVSGNQPCTVVICSVELHLDKGHMSYLNVIE